MSWEKRWCEKKIGEISHRRRTEALKQSREQLIAIVQAWSFVRSFETFFEDVQQRVSTLPAEQRDAILVRIVQGGRCWVEQTPSLTFKIGSHRVNGNSLVNTPLQDN